MLQEQIEQIRELTKLVEQQKVAVKAAADKLKPAFEEYIKDTSIALDERWDFWVAAPVELKNKEPWVEHLDFNGKEIGWFDSPVYAERRMDVYLEEVIEAFEGMERDSYFGINEDNKAAAIEELKETILAANLHSFNNDW